MEAAIVVQRQILGGRTGLKVSPLALGTGLFGLFTAGRRDESVITSKYSRSASAHPSSSAVGNNRKAMAKSVEDSLRRLKTDRIDIYFPHFDDGITPIEKVVRGLDNLVRAGKVLYAGLSNFPAWRVGMAVTLADFRGWVPVAVLQLEYNLIERTAEREFLPMAAALGLGVMGYSPLAVGVLTGKYREGGTGRKGSAVELDPRSNAALDTLLAVSRQVGCSPGAAAIAWSIRKQVVPIVGPRTHAQLQDNLAALHVVLSDDHVRQLDDASRFTPGPPYGVLAMQRGRLGLVDPRTGRVA